MRCLLITFIIALTYGSPASRSVWRPASVRDLSQYQTRLPEVGTRPTRQTHRTSARLQTPIQFKKGWKSFAEECGVENPNGVEDRIVGGHEAKEHQWPWQVALFVDDAWFCGGSLISDEWVMTAAHCADGAGYFDVMAGAHDVRAGSEPHRVEITSFEGHVHPQWDPNNLENDIALVKLPEKIQFSEYIRPACLPPVSDANNGYVGELTTPVGWGKNSDDAGGITPKLQMVSDLPVITNDECNAYYGIINDGIMCIDTTGGKGVCNGDSGGSLNMKQEEENKWTQVGVASFVSSAGCESGNPHGFSRVAKHLEWIETMTGLSLV